MFSQMFKILSPLQRQSLVGQSHLAIFLKWVELLMCEVLGESVSEILLFFLIKYEHC